MQDVLDMIGNTPLVRLRSVEDGGVQIYGKAEFLNPSGSVKDRAAKYMVLDGIRTGKLTKDKVILEATSGNTGVSLAMIGANLGYHVTICMPANVSEEKKKLIRAYGGEVIETNPIESMDGACTQAKKFCAEHPDHCFYPDQYNNPQNARAHVETTSQEIWEQTEGRVTHFVAGTGTSGTFMGTAKGLKEKSLSIRTVLVQPDSPFHGLEGLTDMDSAIQPGIFDRRLADAEVRVSTEDAYDMAHFLARQEGLLVGISAAANVVASRKVAQQAAAGSCIVTVLCDSGSRYLSEPLWKDETAGG